MNIIQRYRLNKISKMTNEAFLQHLYPSGDIQDFINILKWFASKKNCTARKLSAMCYYSYAWGLVFYKREIAPFTFIKTEDGPVDEKIVEMFGLSDDIVPVFDTPEIPDDLERLLNLIWNKYSQHDGKYLMERAKIHFPYLEAEKDIKAKDIFLFYSLAGMI